MKTLILLIVLFSNFSFSDSIYLGMESAHFSWNVDCEDSKCSGYKAPNSHNNLIMIEYKSYEIGTFKNSYYQQTYIIAKQFEIDRSDNFRLVAHVGIDYGYHTQIFSDKINKNALIRPVVGLELEYTRYQIEPVILLFGGGVALSTHYKF